VAITPKMPTFTDLSPMNTYIPSNANSAITLPKPLRLWQCITLLIVEENLLIIEFVVFVIKTHVHNTVVVYVCLHSWGMGDAYSGKLHILKKKL
jgi:hypothetical protein